MFPVLGRGVKLPLVVGEVGRQLGTLPLKGLTFVRGRWHVRNDGAGGTYLSIIVKGGHPKRVPISPEVTASLHEWRLADNIPDPVEPILLNGHGKRLRRGELSYITQSIGREAGIKRFPVTPHLLRHTLNVIRRQSGIDSLTRSALLTHTSPSSNVSYEHLDPSELVDAPAIQRRGLAAYLTNAAQTPSISQRNYEEGLWGTRLVHGASA